MEDFSFVSIIFVANLILSLTIYSIYTGFGPISKELRDPFQEHEE